MRTFKVGIFFFFVTVHFAVAQSASEVFENYIKQNREQALYKVKVAYKMYRGKSTQPFEITRGEKQYTKEGFYERINKVENIIGKDFYTQINHEEKVVFFNPQSIPYKGVENFDITVLEPFFTLSPLDIVQNGTVYKLVFQLKNSIENFQYSQIEFYVDKSTYKLMRQVFYASSAVNFSGVKGKTEFDTQRLEVVYTNYNSIDPEKKGDSRRFEKKTYVDSIGEGQNTSYKLQPRYLSYQLLVGN